MPFPGLKAGQTLILETVSASLSASCYPMLYTRVLHQQVSLVVPSLAWKAYDCMVELIGYGDAYNIVTVYLFFKSWVLTGIAIGQRVSLTL